MRGFIVVALLTCGIALRAQSWDELRGLNPGDRVKVVDTSGQQHKGVFTAVSADAISLEKDNSQIAIERSRVRRVQVRSTSRRVRNALIWSGIGVAVGATLDQTLGTYIRNESQESGGARALTYIAPIALFGGITAARPAYRTVYDAR